MANWSVTTNDLAISVGVQVGVLYPLPYLTITAAGGYTISPENFTIGGATPYYPGSNKWIGGNVDSIVESVEFEAVDPTHVKANVTLSATAVFDADSAIRIDIDESLINPVTLDIYGVCTRVQYPYSSISGYAIDSNATETAQQTGDATQPWIKKYTHFENDLNNLLVFQLTVDPPSTHSIINPTISISSEVEGFEGAFTTSVTSPITGDNKIFSVYYTEPEGGGSYTPCDFGHLVTIDYAEQLISVVETNVINAVNVEAPIGYQGGETMVTVFGTAGAEYTMIIEEDVGGDTYDFTTNTMTGSATSYAGEIGANGLEQLQILIDSSDSSMDYSIKLASAAGSDLKDGVPESNGDLQIKQYGAHTLTIAPITDVGAASFGASTPANLVVKRPIRYSGDSYVDNSVEVVNIKGLTDGPSTKVEITSRNLGIISKLKSGMIVAGDDIPHGTTIKDVNRQHMTLSAEVDLTTSTSLKCVIDMADVIPFSFSIPEGGSGKALSPNTVNNHANSIWGFNDVVTTFSVTESSADDTITVNNADGVIIKAPVIGTGISTDTTVDDVDRATKIVTLSKDHTGTITSGDTVTFKSSSPSVKTINIKATQSGDNVVISGYLLAPKLTTAGAVAKIFLDDIITVAP